MTQEKFCKYAKHPCPECNSRMSIMEYTEDEDGVLYTETYEVCECGYERNITNKRNKNTKIEVE